jgi:hypothetical protein
MLASAAVLALVLPGVGVAGSPAQGTQQPRKQPQPEKLWREYPLDATKGRSPQPAGKTRKPPAAEQVIHGRSRTHGNSVKPEPSLLWPQSTLWIVLVSALVAVAFLGALALARAALRTLWAWADARQRTAAHDVTVKLPEHARFLASESQRGAENDDSARSGRREGSVAAAVLEVLPLATEARGTVDRETNAASRHPAPTPEDATLKRKGAVANGDPVERLKKKAIAPLSEIQRRHEATVLKAKLAEEAKNAPSRRKRSSDLTGKRRLG